MKKIIFTLLLFGSFVGNAHAYDVVFSKDAILLSRQDPRIIYTSSEQFDPSELRMLTTEDRFDQSINLMTSSGSGGSILERIFRRALDTARMSDVPFREFRILQVLRTPNPQKPSHLTLLFTFIVK